MIESQVPAPKELFAEYEAVPDPTWMEINPPRYRLGPGEVGFSDLVIRVPDDPKLGRDLFVIPGAAGGSARRTPLFPARTHALTCPPRSRATAGA